MVDGWILYDYTNLSGFDTKQCKWLRKKLLLVIRTAFSPGIKIHFESVDVYCEMLRLNFDDEKRTSGSTSTAPASSLMCESVCR